MFASATNIPRIQQKLKSWHIINRNIYDILLENILAFLQSKATKEYESVTAIYLN
jgi:hypothetical protein